MLVSEGAVRVSDHGYDELADDGIFAADVIAGCEAGVSVEDYPYAVRGPSVLVLQRDTLGKPIHTVWGIPKGQAGPAVLITAYRPDPAKWSGDFTRRKQP
jgi:uncharacterized protein DUF4258